METKIDTSSEARVLFVAPTARDAEITFGLLARAGLSCVICRSLEEVARLIPEGAGAVLLTEEAVANGANLLLAALGNQPAWSDLPVVLMMSNEAQSPVTHLLRLLTNVTVLDRPAPVRTVTSAVQAAVRGRQRQYQIREQIQTIRAGEERLQFSMEAGNLGSWEIDLVGSTLACSAQCKQIYGRDPASDFSYANLFEAICPQDRQRVAEAMRKALADRVDYVAEYRVLWPDGAEHWVYSRGRADYGRDGGPLRMAGISQDITESKRAELQRQEVLDFERAARTEAERVSRMKDEFLATLSHELRTPLNAILGWSHLLKAGTVGLDDLKEGLDTIERNARAQTELIDDLLDMSRIISGKIRMEFQSIDPAAVVAAAIATVQPAASAKGVKLDAHFPEHAGNITGDPGRLRQIVWNLLSNSIKFTPRGGNVRIDLTRANSQVKIEVVDTGKGIDPDFLPHVFERFRQADAKTTREHGGLGLGLAIVKHLVELHGGTIEVTSEGKGTGATFTIRLPIAAVAIDPDDEDAPRIRKPNAAMPMQPVNFSGIKVLVVDDEPDARELLRRLLQGSSATVVVAASAAEALAVIGTERPDVIVSDIGMPIVDGYDLIKKVRALDHAHGGQIPAVALTAFARAEDRDRARSAGYNTHLAKPVNASELLATIAYLVADPSRAP